MDLKYIHLPSLQISSDAYDQYKEKKYTVDALIVADKLADEPFLHDWISNWLKHPKQALNTLPLCVENEIKLKPAFYATHLYECIDQRDEQRLRQTFVSKGAPEDILNAACMNPLPVKIIKYLFKQGCKPTPKLFIYAVCQDQLSIMRKCLRRGFDINKTYETHTPLEWAIRYGTYEALDTCLIYGAAITDRAITLSMRRPKKFIRICEESDVDLRDDHLYELVLYAYEEHLRNHTVPPVIHQMFQELFIRQVPPGSHFYSICRIRDQITHHPLRADLDIFCEGF